jgi:hypothetical protein
VAQRGRARAPSATLFTKMRDYRDTFVAHLDSALIMNQAELEPARVAITFYYRHIVEAEARLEDLAGLPTVDEFARSDCRCTQQAAAVYRVNLQAK